MAAKNIVQRIVLEGGDEIKKQFEAIGKSGADAFKKLSEAQSVQTGLSAIGNSMDALRTRAAEVGDSFKNVAERFATFGARAASSAKTLATIGGAVTGAATSFAGLVIYAAKTSDELQKTAESIGLTVEQFSRLDFAAKSAGLSTAEFTRGMQNFARAIGNVEKNDQRFANRQQALSRDLGLGRITFEQYTKSLQDLQFEQGQTSNSFERLGVSFAKNADGSTNLEETLKRTSDAFKGLPESATKTALALDLSGSKTGKFVNVLNLGADGMARLGRESERVAPPLSKLGQETFAKLSTAFDVFTAAASSASKAFLVLFAPGITEIINAVTEAIVANRTALIQFGADIAAKVKPIISDIIAFLEGRDADVQNTWIIKARDGIVDFANAVTNAVRNVIVPAFQIFLATLQVVADAVNGVFGTNLTGGQLAIVLTVTKLLGLFGLLGSAIQAVGSLVGVLIAAFGAWPVVLAAIGAAIGVLIINALGGAQGIQDGFAAAWQFIVDTANQMGRGVLVILEGIGSGLKAIADFILSAFGTSVDGVIGFFDRLGSAIGDWAAKAKAFIQPVIDLIKWVSAHIGGGSADANNSAVPLAGGGLVRGPGTPTSDSIPARLSNEEFVMRAKATRRYGVGFMSLVNSARESLPKLAERMAGRGFSAGGLAHALGSSLGMPVPRFADGGPVSVMSGGGGQPIYLQFPGAAPVGPLHAGGDVADQLLRAANSAGIRSAGRKPSWF